MCASLARSRSCTASFSPLRASFSFFILLCRRVSEAVLNQNLPPHKKNATMAISVLNVALACSSVGLPEVAAAPSLPPVAGGVVPAAASQSWLRSRRARRRTTGSAPLGAGKGSLQHSHVVGVGRVQSRRLDHAWLDELGFDALLEQHVLRRRLVPQLGQRQQPLLRPALPLPREARSRAGAKARVSPFTSMPSSTTWKRSRTVARSTFSSRACS